MGRLGGINLTDKILIFKDSKGDEFAIKAKEKIFKTGSKGFYVFGKIIINGKKYQLGGNLVEIHSKPKEE